MCKVYILYNIDLEHEIEKCLFIFIKNLKY